jgi:hypothetical protein
MNARTSIRVIVIGALLLTVGPARAENGDDGRFRTEWEPRLIGGSGAAVQGYVENRSAMRVGDMRLRVYSVDATGRVIGETFGWVIGDVPAGGRGFFVIRVDVPGTTYRISVDSYDAMSPDAPGAPGAAASPAGR